MGFITTFRREGGTDSGPATERETLVKRFGSIVRGGNASFPFLPVPKDLVSHVQLWSVLQFCALSLNPLRYKTLLPLLFSSSLASGFSLLSGQKWSTSLLDCPPYALCLFIQLSKKSHSSTLLHHHALPNLLPEEEVIAASSGIVPPSDREVLPSLRPTGVVLCTM